MSKFDVDNLGNNLIKVKGNIIFKLQKVLDDRNIVINKVDSPCLHGKQIQEEELGRQWTC